MVEHVDILCCPNCGGCSFETGVTVSYLVHSLNEKVSIDFGACSCGFVFQRNPLAWESLKKYYENSPRYRSAIDDSWDRVLCRNQLAFFEHTGPLRSRRVLDIGADLGKMLDLLQASYGCRTAYMEQNEAALHYLRSHGRHEEIKQIQEDSRYDWIILSQVLEHIVNPVTYLEMLRHHVEEEGRIFIEVPNHSFWDSGDYGFSFEHVNYFSPATLASVLQKSGFVVTKLEVCSDERYFQGKFKIIRAVAQAAPLENRQDFAAAVNMHHRLGMGDRFVAAQEIADRFVLDGRPGLALYGAAELADLLLSNTSLGAGTVAGIFDGDRSKNGMQFHGFSVEGPENIVRDQIKAILILSGAEKTICDTIKKFGFKGEIIAWSDIGASKK